MWYAEVQLEGSYVLWSEKKLVAQLVGVHGDAMVSYLLNSSL